MPRDRLSPLRQGHLDGLCGLYSIVNAVRFGLRSAEFKAPGPMPRRRVLCHAEAELLFLTLLGSLVRSRRHTRLVVDGIDPSQLLGLIRLASRWLREHRYMKLTAFQPLRAQPRARTSTLLMWIQRHLRSPGAAAIVGGKHPWEHWTVATRVTASRLYLLDSEGDTSIATKRGKRALQYHAGLMDPSCLYLLTIVDIRSRRIKARQARIGR